MHRGIIGVEVWSYVGYRASPGGTISILYIYPRVRAVGFSIAVVGTPAPGSTTNSMHPGEEHNGYI